MTSAEKSALGYSRLAPSCVYKDPTPPPSSSGCFPTRSRSFRAGGSCQALLLTPKARVIAPLRVWRRAETDFLLLTEPELGAVVRENLIRARFAAKVEIEPEEHVSYVLFGGSEGIPNDEYGRAGGRGAGRARASRRSRACRRGAGAPADPRGDAAVRRRDRRPRHARRGRSRRARRQPGQGLLPRPGADRAAALPRPCEPRAAHRRGGSDRAARLRRRDLRTTARRSAGSRRPSARTARCSRSRTCGSRFPTTPSSPWATLPRIYTRSPRARSSGDRALPCGGRGRTFESCRAHSPPRISPPLARWHAIRGGGEQRIVRVRGHGVGDQVRRLGGYRSISMWSSSIVAS